MLLQIRLTYQGLTEAVSECLQHLTVCRSTGAGSRTLPGPCPTVHSCLGACNLHALTTHILWMKCLEAQLFELLNLCQMMLCRIWGGGLCPGRQVCGQGCLVSATATSRLLKPQEVMGVLVFPFALPDLTKSVKG